MERQDHAGEMDDAKRAELLTLCGLSATCSTPYPGESPPEQTMRIKENIIKQLAMKNLATAGKWELLWVDQSYGGENLAYIAKNTEAHALAVVFRGSVNDFNFNKEDDDVAHPAPFLGDPRYHVSPGSNLAFTKIKDETDFESQLRKFLMELGFSPKPTVYVIGHSLGGAMATMFSLYINSQLGSVCNVQAWTFAAPSAGQKDFADAFDALTPKPVCVWNKYDVIPNSWANLEMVRDGFYPTPPGPVPSSLDQDTIKAKIRKANGQYTQTTQQPKPLNHDYALYALEHVGANSWVAQMEFQHQPNTYLTLLKQIDQRDYDLLPVKPVVTQVKPNKGAAGTKVIIAGANFVDACTVHFYINGTYKPSPKVLIGSDRISITCEVPEGEGIAEVHVNNFVGTSAAPTGLKVADIKFHYSKS